MSLRHAAALALVGWYLMVPPAFYWEAPLSQWSLVSAFDTAAACERVEANWHHCGQVINDGLPVESVRQACGNKIAEKVNSADKLLGTGRPEVEEVDKLGNRYVGSRCVSTDDPRLKEK